MLICSVRSSASVAIYLILCLCLRKSLLEKKISSFFFFFPVSKPLTSHSLYHDQIHKNNLCLLTLNHRCEVEERNTKHLEQQVDVLRQSKRTADQRSATLQADIRHSVTDLQEMHKDFQVPRWSVDIPVYFCFFKPSENACCCKVFLCLQILHV